MDRKQYRKLQQKWYAKLKKSGFEDIEESEYKLKRYDSEWFNKHVDSLRHHSTSQYYVRCHQFGQSYKFESKREEKIWMNYCNGYTLEQIEELVPLKKSQIANIINKLKGIMDGEDRENNS